MKNRGAKMQKRTFLWKIIKMRVILGLNNLFFLIAWLAEPEGLTVNYILSIFVEN
jgi:hypothetical protein